MKDYKTVTQEVLQRSEQRRAAIRRRRQTAAVLTAVALVAALGVCAGRIWRRPAMAPESDALTDRLTVRYSAVALGGAQSPAAAGGGDIVAFSEAETVRRMAAMVEGEVLAVDYREIPYMQQEEECGELHCRVNTVVYTLRVDAVWLGDLSVGETLTIENVWDGTDSPQWLAVGGRYVLPLDTVGDSLYMAAWPGVSGDLQRVSPYELAYQWHSQIEVAKEGYLVPTDWPTLCSGADVYAVVLDDGTPWYPEPVYVPQATFARNMATLLEQQKTTK